MEGNDQLNILFMTLGIAIKPPSVDVVDPDIA
jgi:hypothetical protein